MDNEDDIDLVLGARFEGLEDAKAYAQAMDMVAAAQERAARAMRDASQAARAQSNTFRTARNQASTASTPASAPSESTESAQTRFRESRSAVRASSGESSFGASPAAPRAVGPRGPHEKLSAARQSLSEALRSGMVGDKLSDLHYQVTQAQSAVDRANRQTNPPTPKPPKSQAELSAQAIYSTRINTPFGASPLLGRTLDAVVGKEASASLIGKAGAIASRLGPIAMAGAALLKVAEISHEAAKRIKEMSDESARSAQRMTDARAALGSSSLQSAELLSRGRYLGVDATQAAPAFGQRISSDPTAMANAARLGVANPAGRYGNRDFGQMYQDAIESAAKIEDRRRRLQVSDSLGITQEVERTRLLDANSVARGRFGAGISARINDPRREREAAQYMAAQENFNQARENIGDALGGSFLPFITEVLNGAADTLNFGAQLIHTIDRYLSPMNATLRTLQAIRERIRGKMDPSSVIGPQGSLAPNDLFENAGAAFTSRRNEAAIGEMGATREGRSRDSVRDAQDSAGEGASVDRFTGRRGQSAGWGEMVSFDSTVSTNTSALMENTAAIAKLNKDMVNGRVKNSLPGDLGGIGIERAIRQNQLALGPMGRN